MGKIIRTAITLTYAQLYWQILTILGLGHICVLCFMLGFSVKVILTVPLLHVPGVYVHCL